MTDPDAPGRALAEAASRFVGVVFRLHGRDPATGLDCVGLVACALAIIGRRPIVPAAYALRSLAIEPLIVFATRNGFVDVPDRACAGDLQLFALGGGQHHLAIAAERDTLIHAHAGLGRVVVAPRPGTWRANRCWRLLPTSQGF